MRNIFYLNDAKGYAISILTFALLFITNTTLFGQISIELDNKKGFREIKLLNNITTVKTSDVNKGVDASRYLYAGDSKYLYDINIDEIHIETDGKNIIRKIKLFTSTMTDDDFYKFSKRLKTDFGLPCFSYSKENSTDGILAWKTKSIYMDYSFTYISWGKRTATITLGLLSDLPIDIKMLMYERTTDGF